MMQELTQKQIQLLDCLARRERPISAEELAKRLGISARTVIRYVAVLNEEMKGDGVHIAMKRGQGYGLEGERAPLKRLLSRKERHQREGDKRVHEVVLELIEQEEATIEALGEALFLSPSTLTKLMADVKEFLAGYRLSLASKPHHGLSIEGQETDLRTLLGDIGLDCCNAHLVNTGIHNLTEDEFRAADQMVLGYVQEYGMLVADIDLNHLIARIMISLSRSRKRRYVSGIRLPNPITGHNYQMVQSIMEGLGQRFGIEVTEEECQYVMVYSGFIGYDLSLSGKKDCPDMFRFVNDFLAEISDLTGIRYERDEKVMDILSIHLKALMQRAKAGHYSPNPIIGQIKSNYPLEMNYAILMAQRFEERFGVSINEDEIGYLTVYLGVYQPQAQEQVKAAVLCNYGIGTSQMILENMQNAMRDIAIRGVYPVRYLEMALERKPDVVISAVPVEGYQGEVPLIVARDLLDQSSLQDIRKRIWQLINIEKELMGYFDPGCFKLIRAGDRFDAIAQLGALLKERKGIGDEVIKDIERRERISSTEVGNLVAVPHVLKQGDFPACIAIGILDKPIEWGSEMVQMVFLACFNQSGERSARVFRTLYKAVRSDRLVRSLIQTTEFGQFKKIFCRGDCI